MDKNRNPISYQIYQGNTYEGIIMIDALNTMKQQFTIDRVVVVADTAMIDKENRNFMVNHQIDYIIGDSIKTPTKAIKTNINKANHHAVQGLSKETPLVIVKSHTREDVSYVVILPNVHARCPRQRETHQQSKTMARRTIKI